jgi:hypothetical protein
MLTVRREQVAAFRRAPRLRFENLLVRHCFDFHARQCEWLGPEQVRRIVQQGIESAAAQGYTTQREAAYFVSLMFLLGSAFYRDPQLPWARGELGESTLRERAGPIPEVYRAARDYLDATAGVNNEYRARAVGRMRAYDLGAVPPSPGTQFADDLCKRLNGLYPEKYAYQGDAATRALIRSGMEAAAGYGISDSQGVAGYVILMFVCGAGFDRDLLYPWAMATLDDPSLKGPGVRGLRLYRAGMDHLAALGRGE